jgi:hypothetical protein
VTSLDICIASEGHEASVTFVETWSDCFPDTHTWMTSRECIENDSNESTKMGGGRAFPRCKATARMFVERKDLADVTEFTIEVPSEGTYQTISFFSFLRP